MQDLKPTLHEAAVMLALANARSDKSVKEIWLFRDDEGKEIRIVAVLPHVIISDDETNLTPFYFAPDADTPYWSAIALIGPKNWGHLNLPAGWGTWPEAEKLWPEDSAR